MLRRLLILPCLVTVLMTGCSAVKEPVCAAGEQRTVSDLLFFGTAKPGGVVSADDWAKFLAEVVTPRFPEGLTVWTAAGQWRSAAGSQVHEQSYVLSLVHQDGANAEESIRIIVAEYKSRFQQESVLRVRSDSCASF